MSSNIMLQRFQRFQHSSEWQQHRLTPQEVYSAVQGDSHLGAFEAFEGSRRRSRRRGISAEQSTRAHHECSHVQPRAAKCSQVQPGGRHAVWIEIDEYRRIRVQQLETAGRVQERCACHAVAECGVARKCNNCLGSLFGARLRVAWRHCSASEHSCFQ